MRMVFRVGAKQWVLSAALIQKTGHEGVFFIHERTAWNSRVTYTEASAWSNIIFLLTQSHSVANTMGQIYSSFASFWLRSIMLLCKRLE